MLLTHVSFHNSGYCSQWSYLAGRPSWGLTRFYGLFLYFEHPEHGGSLIDTGYSKHFFTATQKFPARFYRWLTPVRLDPRENAAAILHSQGIALEHIRRVFVSHFHGDHIAGLKHFPNARFIYPRAAYESLIRQPTWKQVRHAFLADCLPEDFLERGEPLSRESFVPGPAPLEEFSVLDYWGDGSLLLIDLPGHADGHLGFVLTTATKRWFYITDATWDLDALLTGRTLPWLSRRIQHDYPAYRATQERLRRLAKRGELELVACHCPRSQRHVAPAAD